MGLAPGVKPAGIEFAANQRTGGLYLAHFCKVFFHIATKVSRLKQVREHPVFHDIRRVAFEQRHIKPGSYQSLLDFLHIRRVLAKKAVFIFHLRHYDRAPVGDLLRPEHTADLL